jgi:hypothetical protein
MIAEDTSISLMRCQIERVVHPHSFRGTRSAKFQSVDGFFWCEAFFEGMTPRIQVRWLVTSLEESATLMAALQLANEWLVEEMQREDFFVERKGDID